MSKDHTFWSMWAESSGFWRKKKRAFEEEDETIKGVSESDGIVIETRVFKKLNVNEKAQVALSPGRWSRHVCAD